MTHGTRSGYNGGCRCPSCTEANTAASRERRRRLASHDSSRPPSPCRHEAGDTTGRSARGNGSVGLVRDAQRTGRTLCRCSGIAGCPERLALQSLPHPVAQVSRFIPAGCPAYRLVVGCGCPFGWDTPDIPDWIKCSLHERQRVLSSASSDSWGGPLALAEPA
jgi:hypothetical protein